VYYPVLVSATGVVVAALVGGTTTLDGRACVEVGCVVVGTVGAWVVVDVKVRLVEGAGVEGRDVKAVHGYSFML
jgi:hypothetical protein